jgi:hypothetical protein
LTSITSRAFTGQLGSAEQNSNIHLAGGKYLHLQGSGSGEAVIRSKNGSGALQLFYNEGLVSQQSLETYAWSGTSLYPTGLVDGVDVALFNALYLGGL